MATGDTDDITARLKGAIPKGWFADIAPVRDALFAGYAYALSLMYSLISFTKLQTRIKTATDGFLDLVSFDYFGTTLPRGINETDDAFRTRIEFNLLREKATRKSISNILKELTGYAPQIFEPWRPLDTGAWNVNIWGWNRAGGWGSLAIPYQAFITAYRPPGQGIANIAGWNDPEGALSTGSQTEWANQSLISASVTDADMFAAVADTKVEGTIAWMQIQPAPNIGNVGLEDGSGDIELEDGTGNIALENT